MKKKVLSALLTATLLFSIGMPAFATPNEEVIENQAKYDELTAKIDVATKQADMAPKNQRFRTDIFFKKASPRKNKISSQRETIPPRLAVENRAII